MGIDCRLDLGRGSDVPGSDEGARCFVGPRSLTVVIDVYSRMVLGFSIYPRLVVANNVEGSVAPIWNQSPLQRIERPCLSLGIESDRQNLLARAIL
jgi:transposase InsO family protein